LEVLPWDSDLDVQVTEKTMHFLASYYNMTVFRHRTSRFPKGRDYLLEINPHYVIRDDSDTENIIDARWIDMTSGLFIDITTARYDENHPEGKNVLTCKDGHQYRVYNSKNTKQVVELIVGIGHIHLSTVGYCL
jgi:hypothetical protein